MKRALQYANRFEPARLRATWVALVALAATLGLGQYVESYDAKVQAVISALAVLLPILQGEATRANVYAPANVEAGHAEDTASLDGDDSLEQASQVGDN